MRKHYEEVEEYRVYGSKAEVHKAVNSLLGIISGIKFDGVVTTEELEEITNWCNLHRHLKKKSPFSEIIPMIDDALFDNELTSEEMEDILWLCQRVIKSDEFDDYYNMITSSIQQLEGILHGMLADNVLSDEEISQLSKWMEDREFLKGSYPFDEIDSLLVSARSDGIISQDERNMLTAFFANFIDTRISYNINEFEMKALQSKYSVNGICAVCPEIAFTDKTFCFTGTSTRAKRNEIARIIEDMGGSFTNTVTKKTDYLIVGGDGNPCWAFSCYGRKVEKAVQMRKEGSQIIIIHENDFWDEIN
ncbi:BRCT domain-containing protein [Cytobacillus spongiae]|uniref:BRCT domain-containing protein n=1 Tax=Cytobacillus spongiae TaxID=2901381 RepID=UPI001F1F8E7C|nr:BRCT domain-containing protein [Cytobacillus spongiae]UII56677.1 BRCT domain-containing protein [Cytobacillus spongiae]